MRSGFFWFITVALGVYSLVNVFLIWRSWVMLAGTGIFRILGPLAFFTLSLAYPLGRYLEHRGIEPLGSGFTWTGSFWLAAMLYLLIGFLLTAIADIPIWLLGKPGWGDVWFQSRPLVWSGLAVAVALLLCYGRWNALNPRLVELHWTFPKLAAGSTPVRIVAVSDIHTGTLIGRKRVEKIVTEINALEPDLVLLVGDTIDSDLEPVLRENSGAALLELKARYGVYGVTGNHEYIGGVRESADYLEAHGVRLLRDQAVLIADSFYLVGREDISLNRFTRAKREPLANLLAPIDRSRPVLIMDHQPVAIDEAAALEADGLLCGHTHRGQLWPFNYITQSVFKLDHGFGQYGPLHVYVSPGVGTWGPPVRIGNRPEIVVITVSPE